jgi:RHS repeat-associated protein
MIEKSGTLGTTTFMQDEAGHLIGEYDGSGNLLEETIWLGDIPVATLQPNGSGGVDIFYVHTDHLNAPRKVAQPTTGTLAWRWDTDPFGTTAPNQNPAGLGTFVYNLRAPGQYYQAETGLNQNYNRDYDPLVGRYVESDPIGLYGGSWSTYAYARGNPVSSDDPAGLAPPFGGRPAPAPLPPNLIPPDIAIPGSPENTAWAQGMAQEIGDAINALGQAIYNVCTKNSNFCYDRWEQEDQRCSQWRGLGSRAVAACRTRAADRRNLCVANGGKPDPNEPPEYNPFKDYPR